MKRILIAAVVATLCVSAAHAIDILRLPGSTDLTDTNYWDGGALPGGDNVALFDANTLLDTNSVTFTGAGNSAEGGAGAATWGFGGYKFLNTIGPINFSTANVQYIYGLGVTVSNAAYDVTFENIRCNRSQMSDDWYIHTNSVLRANYISAGGGRSYYTIPIKGGGTVLVNGSAAVGSGTRLSFDVSGVGTTIGGNGTWQPNTCDTTYGMVVGADSVIAPGEITVSNEVGTLTIDSAFDGVPCLYLSNSIVKFDLGSGVGSTYALPSSDSDQVLLTSMAAGDVVVTNVVIDLQNSDSDGVFRLFDTDGGSNTWVGLTLSGQEITGGFSLINVASAQYSLVMGDGTTGEDGDIYLVIGTLGEQYVPANVTWTAGTGDWDIDTSLNWDNGSGASVYFEAGGIGDAVIFDDTAVGGTITLNTNVYPSAVTIDSTYDYTITGTGAILGSTALTKTGSGTFTTGLSDSYSGGTSIGGGTVELSSTGATLGSGAVTLTNDALLIRYRGNTSDGGYSETASTFANELIIPAGATGTVWNTPRGTWSGALTGSGTFNLRINATRGDFTGDWSAFTGQINVASRTGADDFRIALGYGSGLQLASGKLNLTDGVYMYQTVNANSGSDGTPHNIGELSGTSGAIIGGNPIGGRYANWVVGALNTDSTFAGTIQDNPVADPWGGYGAAKLTKVGTGMLTLSGTNTYSGATTVNGGTLYISGAIGAATTVASVTVNTNAAIGGSGAIDGNLTMNDGALFAFAAGDTLSVSSSLNFTTNTFGADDVVGIASNTVEATYTLIDGFTNTLSGIDTAAYIVNGHSCNLQVAAGSLQLVVGTGVIPDISGISISGGFATLYWESGAYNVYTNRNLGNAGGWGIATNAATPVSIPVGNGSELFFRLGN